MATFPIANPVYNTRINASPKVNVLSFGDGFEQRLTEGLNQNPLSVNLTFGLSKMFGSTINPIASSTRSGINCFI